MKIVILYKPNSDHGRVVEEYLHEFAVRNPEVSFNALSVETREGANTATLYDVMQYPSMLALRQDGSIAKSWQGLPLPLINDVAYFTIA
ncbi:hypothetical protein EB118_11975 [bacterium]|nr:hypothetical protein [bacterium]NBX97743.1 hypothetical protein [bacterium]NDC94949.1 hypothetical protein [bacterium]NDD84684.1 hypothetical protein [bacterium]NDG30778.1 hypothetical protein [bacterium]